MANGLLATWARDSAPGARLSSGRIRPGPAPRKMAASEVTMRDLERTGIELLVAGGLERWTRRWGPIASPLLWPHAMHLILVDAVRVAP